MQDNQKKLQGSDIKLTSSNKFLNRLDNFWFHHKWKLIIGVFFAIVLTVGIVQMLKKKDADIDVTVATHTIFYTEQVEGLERSLTSLMPRDMNGDGKKKIQLNLYKIYSEEELREANEAETDEDENPIIYADESYNKSQIEQYNSYIGLGQGSVMILSEYLYNDILNRRDDPNKKLLVPMSDIFGEQLPEGIMDDGYGIRLTETGAYKNLDGLDFLPSDSVICVLRSFVLNGKNGEEKHQRAIEYFKSIVEFGK